jgi:hypothetical protein
MLAGLAAGSARANQIQPTDFHGNQLVEGFEGLTVGTANTATTAFRDILEVAVSTSFLFGSGVSLTDPVPNPVILNAGAFVHDFALQAGSTTNDWGANGSVSNVAHVPWGSGYIAIFGAAGSPPSLEFSFATPQHRVGAWVTGRPGNITLDVYDVNGALLESASIATVHRAQWRNNFLGIHRSEGIGRIVFTGEDFGVDNLTFEAPEPTTGVLVLLGLTGIAAFRSERRARA